MILLFVLPDCTRKAALTCLYLFHTSADKFHSYFPLFFHPIHLNVIITSSVIKRGLCITHSHYGRREREGIDDKACHLTYDVSCAGQSSS